MRKKIDGEIHWGLEVQAFPILHSQSCQDLWVRLRNVFTKFVLKQVVTICTTCFDEGTLSAKEFFVNDYLRNCILEEFAKCWPL